jgi:hypothetical protein
MMRSGVAAVLFGLFITVTVRGEPPIDVKDHRAEIREALLKYTPIGSTPQDVLKFISERLLHQDELLPSMENHGATGPRAEHSSKRGVRIIRLYLGHYFDHPETFFLSAPVLMEKAVTAQWAFDDRNHLIEIFVDKEAGVY